MARRGRSEAELEQRRKADAEKIKTARRRRAGTTMPWGWIAERLALGASRYTADCLHTTQRVLKKCESAGLTRFLLQPNIGVDFPSAKKRPFCGTGAEGR
jgi:hypothetical protein